MADTIKWFGDYLGGGFFTCSKILMVGCCLHSVQWPPLWRDPPEMGFWGNQEICIGDVLEWQNMKYVLYLTVFKKYWPVYYRITLFHCNILVDMYPFSKWIMGSNPVEHFFKKSNNAKGAALSIMLQI